MTQPHFNGHIGKEHWESKSNHVIKSEMYIVIKLEDDKTYYDQKMDDTSEISSNSEVKQLLKQPIILSTFRYIWNI